MKLYLSELVGTFFLVLIGTGSVVLSLSGFWISFAFGAIVFLMVMIFGPVSGAHINPIVSISFYLINKDKTVLYYVPFQLIGAFLASLLIWAIVPATPTFGETVLSVPLLNGIVIEFFISFGLMFTILLIIRRGSLFLTAFVVGFYVFLAAYIYGPMTGASMNPARTFGPAIFSHTMSLYWMYFLVPILGGAASVFVENFLIKRNFLAERS